MQARRLSTFTNAEGFMLRVEPCPPSRHMTATPGMHTAINAFKQHGPRALQAAGADGEGGLGSGKAAAAATMAASALPDGVGSYGSGAAPTPVPPRLVGHVPPPDARPAAAHRRGQARGATSGGGRGGSGSSDSSSSSTSSSSSSSGGEEDKDIGVATLTSGPVPLPRPLLGRRPTRSSSGQQQQDELDNDQPLPTQPFAAHMTLPALAVLPVPQPEGVLLPPMSMPLGAVGSGGGSPSFSPRARAAKRQAMMLGPQAPITAAPTATATAAGSEIFGRARVPPSEPPSMAPAPATGPHQPSPPPLQLPPWAQQAQPAPAVRGPPHAAAAHALYWSMTRTLPPVAPSPADAFAAPLGAGAGAGAAMAVFGQSLPDEGVASVTEMGSPPPELDEDLLENLFD